MKYKLIVKFSFTKGIDSYEDPQMIKEFIESSYGTIDGLIEYDDAMRIEAEKRAEELEERILTKKDPYQEPNTLYIETFRKINEIIDDEFAKGIDCVVSDVSFDTPEGLFNKIKNSIEPGWNTNILIHSMALIDLDNNTTVLISWGDQDAKRIYYSKEALAIWEEIMENKKLIKNLMFIKKFKYN